MHILWILFPARIIRFIYIMAIFNWKGQILQRMTVIIVLLFVVAPSLNIFIIYYIYLNHILFLLFYILNHILSSILWKRIILINLYSKKTHFIIYNSFWSMIYFIYKFALSFILISAFIELNLYSKKTHFIIYISFWSISPFFFLFARFNI